MSSKEKEAAYAAALRYLTSRARSVEEMRHQLARKKFSSEIIQGVISRLKDERLLDDTEFTRMYIDSRERTAPRSRYALFCELRHKGVAESTIQAALEGVDEYASAWNAVSRRLSTWHRRGDAEFKKKLFNYLQYRGFGYEIIRAIWEQARKTGTGDTGHEY